MCPTAAHARIQVMSSATYALPRRRPLWPALRGAQALLLLLGTAQLAAVAALVAGDAPTRAGWALGTLAAAAATASLVVALLLPRRTHLIRDAAQALLRCQVALCLAEILARGAWGWAGILALAGLAWPLLAIDARRHPSIL
jgi:hypothetical protein